MACNARREHVGYLLRCLVVGAHNGEARSKHACVSDVCKGKSKSGSGSMSKSMSK